MELIDCGNRRAFVSYVRTCFAHTTGAGTCKVESRRIFSRRNNRPCLGNCFVGDIRCVGNTCRSGIALKGIVRLCPKHKLGSGNARLVRTVRRCCRIRVVDRLENCISGLVVCNMDIRCIIGEASAVTGSIQNFSVDVEILSGILLRIVGFCTVGDRRPVLRRITAVGGRFNMLSRIKPKTVNTAVNAILEQIQHSLLYVCVVGIEIGASRNMSLNDFLRITIAVRIQIIIAKIGSAVIIKIGLVRLRLNADSVFTAHFLIAEMIGNNITDNLNTVLVRLCAESGQIGLGAQPCLLCDLHADRLVKLPPLSADIRRRGIIFWLLHRRGLHSRITRRGNSRQIILNCVVRPVERVQDHAVLNIFL